MSYRRKVCLYLLHFCAWHVTTQTTVLARASESTGHIDSAFATNLRPRLDAIDRIRNLLSGANGGEQLGIDLPSIVVVGDQNSGKSSVLEGLSGVDLPRGDGLVTRCPLILKLRRAEHFFAVLSYVNQDGKIEWSNSLTQTQIPLAIKQATKVLAGTQSHLVDKAITLEVSKPDAPDLTMVDLPGIVRNPIGNQPKDIEERIRKLILSHIEGDSKIVLCVLPATSDFATQEAIKLARMVDPHGQRTLGVVTKVDLASWGLRARLEATADNQLRMELGYVAVRCRTQEELTGGTSPEVVLQRESEFFQSHAELSYLPDEYKGMPALVDKLVKLQGLRIHSHLPFLKKQVEDEVHATRQQLASMQGVIHTAADAENWLSGLLDRLQRRFEGLVNAEYDVAAGDHDNKPLHVAPRVDEMLTEYKDKAWEDIGGRNFFFTTKCHQLLRYHSKEVRGTGLPNLLGDRVFKVVYTQAVYSKLPPAAVGLVDSVHHYLAEVLDKLTEDVFAGLPRLGAEVQSKVQHELLNVVAKAKASVSANLDSERHIFTSNDDYLKTLVSLKKDIMSENSTVKGTDKSSKAAGFTSSILAMDKWRSKAPEDFADDATRSCPARYIDGDDIMLEVLSDEALMDLQLSLAAYTQIVMKNVCDTVPKLVYNQLVKKMATSLQTMLQKRLHEDEHTSILSLMHDPQRTIRYNRLKEKLTILIKASQELMRI